MQPRIDQTATASISKHGPTSSWKSEFCWSDRPFSFSFSSREVVLWASGPSCTIDDEFSAVGESPQRPLLGVAFHSFPSMADTATAWIDMGVNGRVDTARSFRMPITPMGRSVRHPSRQFGVVHKIFQSRTPNRLQIFGMIIVATPYRGVQCWSRRYCKFFALYCKRERVKKQIILPTT